jgi:predicted O-linked N-acetylglucosamine transferase (SPINDLY family)
MMQTQENQLKHHQQTLLRNPKDLAAQIECGNLCVELSRYEEAAGYFRRLVRILKNNQEIRGALCYALQALGNEAHAQGRYAMAEACFSEALTYEPNNVAYLYNAANALRELGKPKDAALHYQKAINLSPHDADIYNNLGNVQRELGELNLAIASYEKALQINPKLFHAKVHLAHQKQHICDWASLDKDIAQIKHWVNTEPSAQISPFAFIAMQGTTMAEQRQCASNWIANRFTGLLQQAQQLNFQYTKNHKKIKIGYLSADFRLHPLAFLITELIELHDRSTFEAIAFSYGIDDKTKTRARLEKAFDAFYDIRHLSEVEAAKKINACEIDILVDLTGFTQTSRTGIAALRPAPVNVNWLGYASTMGYTPNGKPLFDYLLTDNIISPAEQAADYAEQLAILPCYQPNDSKRPIDKAPSRDHCKLPEGAFVFCCFNQSFKFTPDVFGCWMRILKATPNSVLWLLDCNVWAKNNLIQTAAAHGIAESRMIFAPRVALGQHLARHVHADLFLDTTPYNAHTTCSDALWMNLPVLTCMGDTFSARVSASLLDALNLNELITHDLQAYETKALELANNPLKLLAIKQAIIANKTNSVLFNTAQFVQSLEKAYQSMLNNI